MDKSKRVKMRFVSHCFKKCKTGPNFRNDVNILNKLNEKDNADDATQR